MNADTQELPLSPLAMGLWHDLHRTPPSIRLRSYGFAAEKTLHQIGSDCRDRTYEYAINSRGYYHSSQVGIVQVSGTLNPLGRLLAHSV